MIRVDMDGQQGVYRSGPAFFGRITASVTHEINNVLSTVGELSGLLEDLVAAGAQKGPIPPEKLRHLAERLTAQVSKGTAIIKRLNRFAHSTDEPAKTVDLGDTLALVVALAGPFARRKQATLETHAAGEPFNVQTDPFLLEHAVFLGLEYALQSGDPRWLITVSAARHEQIAEIIISFVPLEVPAMTGASWPLLAVLMRQLGGTVACTSGENNTHHLVLTIPLTESGQPTMAP